MPQYPRLVDLVHWDAVLFMIFVSIPVTFAQEMEHMDGIVSMSAWLSSPNSAFTAPRSISRMSDTYNYAAIECQSLSNCLPMDFSSQWASKSKGVIRTLQKRPISNLLSFYKHSNLLNTLLEHWNCFPVPTTIGTGLHWKDLYYTFVCFCSWITGKNIRTEKVIN